MGVMVAPSLLSADFGCLRSDIAGIEPYVDLWHIDVMDGHFVPNITIGPFVVRAIKGITAVPLDVHLMICDPLKYAKEFLKIGLWGLTAHIEAFPDEGSVREFISTVRDSGAKAGLSLRPKTEMSKLIPFLEELDLVLVMSVEPGFGGQKFMPEVLDKVKALRDSYNGIISIDGGINPETAQLAKEAGVNLLVAGNAIFSQKDRVSIINAMKG